MTFPLVIWYPLLFNLVTIVIQSGNWSWAAWKPLHGSIGYEVLAENGSILKWQKCVL